jgi:hypothetical protein
MTQKLAQIDAKLEQEKKKMALAQHDFKSGQMIQILDGYTMVHNYSAPDKERDHHRIICK